jgi:hypothetical protein
MYKIRLVSLVFVDQNPAAFCRTVNIATININCLTEQKWDMGTGGIQNATIYIHLEKTENALRTQKWIKFRHFFLCTKSDWCLSSSWIKTRQPSAELLILQQNWDNLHQNVRQVAEWLTTPFPGTGVGASRPKWCATAVSPSPVGGCRVGEVMCSLMHALIDKGAWQQRLKRDAR